MIGLQLRCSTSSFFPPLFLSSPLKPHPKRISIIPMATPTPNSSNSDSDQILHKFLFFTVYKDGRTVVHSPPLTLLPAGNDPLTAVKTKDVLITPTLSARLFLPSKPPSSPSLPILLYFHGGGFCMESPFSTTYTAFLTHLVSSRPILAVSVDYSLFPLRPLPACYHDSLTSLNWLLSSPDPWISRYSDPRRVFLAGDSAGANICHTLAASAAEREQIKGMVLIHPYFGEGDEMWMYMCPDNEGPMDRRMRPNVEDLRKIGCGRVLVFVGGKDGLREAGVKYVEELKKSGWKGVVELVENEGKDHCFHLFDDHDHEAGVVRDRIVSFIFDVDDH